jgi:hypothetical protein
VDDERGRLGRAEVSAPAEAVGRTGGDREDLAVSLFAASRPQVPVEERLVDRAAAEPVDGGRGRLAAATWTVQRRRPFLVETATRFRPAWRSRGSGTRRRAELDERGAAETQTRRNGGLSLPTPTCRCCGTPPKTGDTIDDSWGFDGTAV